jgi:hypothetical protein
MSPTQITLNNNLREPQPQKGNLGSLNLNWKALDEEMVHRDGLVSNCLDIWWRERFIEEIE